MRAIAIVTLLLLPVCAQAAASDLYSTINDIRSSIETCASTEPLPPLDIKPQLEQAAAAIAQGGELAASVQQSGYRANRLVYIGITGGSEENQLALLRQQYCVQLLDTDVADVGIHQSEPQLVIVLAARFDPQAADTQEAAARKMLALVNAARAEPRNCGNEHFEAADPLRWNDILATAARSHADNMAYHNYFGHDGLDGSTPGQRAAYAGYPYRVIGENLSGGQQTPEQAMAVWIESPQHCAVLMAPFFTEMGSAYSVSNASTLGVYWVQEFGTPR